jgi:uroporphyrinogen-III synthase
MRVLFLRPKDAEIPEIKDKEVINISIYKSICLKYNKPDYDNYEGILFTSINAYKCFNEKHEILGKKIFAVGPSTAKYIGDNVIYPEKFTTEELGKLVLKSGVRNIIGFRSKRANSTLINILKEINYLEIYNYDLILDEKEFLRAKEFLENCKVDYVVLTSSEIARAVLPFLRKCYKIISIGPRTSQVLKQRNDLVYVEARTHNIKGVIDIILEG